MREPQQKEVSGVDRASCGLSGRQCNVRALGSWNRERCPESSQGSPREELASELLPDYNRITKPGGRGSKERRDEGRSIRQKSKELKAEGEKL